MTERSRPWSGTVLGDSGPYSDDSWTDVWKQFAPVIASQGVLVDQLSGLNLAGLPITPVDISSGRALVNGIWYETDATVSVAVPSPAVNPRVDRIVLRADWALQTVRVHRIAGVEAASPSPPSLVQIDGTTWDLPLWQVHATVAGVVSVFRDERSFIGQYTPAAVTDDRVYMETEFFIGDTAVGDGFSIEQWEVEVLGTGVINAEANFGTGVIGLRYVGGGPGATTNIRNRGHRPDLVDGHWICRMKQPNTHANLDRVAGFTDSAISLTPTNGVFFRSDGVANWFAVTRAAGVETATDTGQALDDTFRKFETRQDGIGVVTFLIDDVVVATHQADIPAADLFMRVGIFDDGGAPATNTYIHLDRVTYAGNR